MKKKMTSSARAVLVVPLFVFMTLSFMDIMSTRLSGPLTLERRYLHEKTSLTYSHDRRAVATQNEQLLVTFLEKGCLFASKMDSSAVGAYL